MHRSRSLVDSITTFGMVHDYASFRLWTRVMASNVTSASTASRADAAYAPARSKFVKRFSTSRVSVSVSPEILPETTLTAPNSPTARAGREHHAVRQSPPDRGERHPPERLPPGRPQRRCGLFLVVPNLAQHRHDLTDDKWQAHEDRRQNDARGREDDLDADRLQRVAQPAPAPVQQRQRQPDDHRRDRKRQVDERLEKPTPADPAAHQHQRRHDAEHRVEGEPRSR